MTDKPLIEWWLEDMPRARAWQWTDWTCVAGAVLAAAGLIVPLVAEQAWDLLLPLGLGMISVGIWWGLRPMNCGTHGKGAVTEGSVSDTKAERPIVVLAIYDDGSQVEFSRAARRRGRSR